MKHPVFFAAAIVLALGLGGCASMSAQYERAIASPVRTDQDRSADAARRPAVFLPLTQVKPGMQVLDVSAAGGYTTQLLALVVGPTGIVYAQNPPARPGLTKRLGDQPQANIVPVARLFEDPVPEQAPKLDLITLIQNYHDICNAPVDRAKMNARLFSALKPGGHLVVVDHSARSGTGLADTKSLHRIDEAVVRGELLQAGFKVEAESDYLRNPADPRDQMAYQSKIPTDKFALRFVKPQ